jgi:hypothetical protein
MPRQVVGSERSKANPVKGLRSHTLTLASRTESDKGKSPGASTLDSEMGASRVGATGVPADRSSSVGWTTGVPGERSWLAGVGDRVSR